MRDEITGQPVEQFGVAGLAAFPVMGRFDEAGTHEPFPDAVHINPSEAPVYRGGDECGETFSRVLRIVHQAIDAGVVDRAGGGGKGPLGSDRFVGLEGDLDERFTPFFLEEPGRWRAQSPSCGKASPPANTGRAAWCCDKANHGSARTAVQCRETWRR